MKVSIDPCWAIQKPSLKPPKRKLSKKSTSRIPQTKEMKNQMLSSERTNLILAFQKESALVLGMANLFLLSLAQPNSCWLQVEWTSYGAELCFRLGSRNWVCTQIRATEVLCWLPSAVWVVGLHMTQVPMEIASKRRVALDAAEYTFV